MVNTAFYVYGIVRGIDLDWQEKGIAGETVYTITQGNFSVLVHNCEDKIYASTNPEEIKEMILVHNRILDKAIEDFGGVIPLSFNTIIKKGTNLARLNLKKWLNDEQEKLEKIWNKIKLRKEYGLRIYYEKEKLFQDASVNNEVKQMEKDMGGKGLGVSYLLRGKVKFQIQEIFHENINKLKQGFYEEIKKITKDLTINPPRVCLEEEKDLLLSLSILAEEKQVNEVKEFLEKKAEDFPFYIAGPFAPYSFVENEK